MDVSESQHDPQLPDTGNVLVSPDPAGSPLGSGTASNRARTEPEPGSIRAEAISFMQRVNSTFGEDSSEWTNICQGLKEFTAGRLSKREAYGTMVGVLGNNQSLKQGLEDFLHHRDALWEPGDFDQPAAGADHETAAQTSPDFLQPQHQPQFRLFPTPTAWGSSSSQQAVPSQQQMESINPALLRSRAHHDLDRAAPLPQHSEPYEMMINPYGWYSGYGGHEDYRVDNSYHLKEASHAPNNWNSFFIPNGLPSSATLPTSETPSLYQYITDSTIQLQNPSTYNYRTEDIGFSSPKSLGTEQPRYSYSVNEYNDNVMEWHGNGSSYLSESVNFPGPSQESRTSLIANNEPTAQFAPAYQSSPDETLYPLRVPYVTPLGHETADKKRSRKCSVASRTPDLPPAAAEASMAEMQSPSPTVKDDDTQPKKKGGKSRVAREDCHFIHGLCGKAFRDRSAVKKHHWGKKVGDPLAVTGCWAKHNKPNVEWDDHPSCKPAHVTLKTESHQSPPSPQLRAPVVPSMVAAYTNTIPGFPTLQGLPNTVEEAIHASPAFSGAPKDNFESLLTAAKAAAEVDAQPNGRSDSLVSPEANAPDWSSTTISQRSSGAAAEEINLKDKPHTSARHVGLGIQVPASMILPSQH